MSGLLPYRKPRELVARSHDVARATELVSRAVVRAEAPFDSSRAGYAVPLASSRTRGCRDTSSSP